MRYQNILFDLDGTITDSKEGIINGVLYALEKAGLQVEDKDSLLTFIGPPILDSFMNYDQSTEEVAKERVRDFREYYSEKGVWENELYPGIPELLESLDQVNLYIATAKREDYVLPILQHFQIDHYFKGIVGAPVDGRISFKKEIIAEVLEKYQLEPSSSLMIGDHIHDMEGAQANGLDFIAALYGYGDQEILIKEKYKAKDVWELKNLLEKMIGE